MPLLRLLMASGSACVVSSEETALVGRQKAEFLL